MMWVEFLEKDAQILNRDLRPLCLQAKGPTFIDSSSFTPRFPPITDQGMT
jgi:hypothetical protein